MAKVVAKWDTYEVWFAGTDTDEAYVEVELTAIFSCHNRSIWVRGFYDGNGRYGLRYMPDTEGVWSYTTQSNAEELDGLTGEFDCIKAKSNGPVVVSKGGKLARLGYADGSDYSCIGTTCYCWTHQGEELENKTLKTLAKGQFNKIRMCIFPKHYVYNSNDPEFYPFAASKDGDAYQWDFSRFDPRYWRHLEKRIIQLRDLGIEADLILFHPYDRWGFDRMPHQVNLDYLRYAVARLSSYRNVWWSFANEYDLMRNKSLIEWDEYFKLVATEDPAGHLRSIHNCNGFYDYTKSWVTHCSIQSSEIEKVPQWLEIYEKPVVIDECCYEGDIPEQWGNITAMELVNRMWTGFSLGGYVGHGETYLSQDDVLWWSRGGVLRGEAPERILFLRNIIESMPKNPTWAQEHPWRVDGLNFGDEKFLYYYGVHQPSLKYYKLPEGKSYEAEIFDAWNMTIEKSGMHTGEAVIPLPAKPYCGVILTYIPEPTQITGVGK
jgi:hypothetical protein